MNLFSIIICSTICFCYSIIFCRLYPFFLFSARGFLPRICFSVIRNINFYCSFSKVLESKFILK
nr:MAG TPA: hypothetical protein [Caudoviricetes sp.]